MIDSNIIIDNFGNKLPKKSQQFLFSIDLIISAVTKIEILGWQGASAQQLKPLYDFMEMALILPINDDVVEQTISMRQSKKIALGDALIAATAFVFDLTLISRNIKDFKNIDGLKIINPYQL